MRRCRDARRGRAIRGTPLAALAYWLFVAWLWHEDDTIGLTPFLLAALLMPITAFVLGRRAGAKAAFGTAAAFALVMAVVAVAFGAERRSPEALPCSLDTWGACEQSLSAQLVTGLPVAVILAIAGALGAASAPTAAPPPSARA